MTTFLLVLLVLGFLAAIVFTIVTILRKRDNGRYDKITAVATMLTALTTTVVGIVTVSVAQHQEDMDMNQIQPLYKVTLSSQWDSEKERFVNEEYSIVNEGHKTKNKTNVQEYTFLEIHYEDMEDNSKKITKLIPYHHYFAANVNTNNLDGTPSCRGII